MALLQRNNCIRETGVGVYTLIPVFLYLFMTGGIYTVIKVIVPNKQYNDKAHGVQFNNGVAEFENEAYGREIAKRLGYKVEEVTKPAVKAEAEKAPAKRKAPAKKPAEKEAVKKG